MSAGFGVVEKNVLSLRDMEFLTALSRRKHFTRAAEECGGCCHVNSLRLEVDIAAFDHASFAADFHASNASSR